jgi:glyoxylase I family protein
MAAATRPRSGKAPAPNTVLGLDHLVLRVRDLAASIDFYKRVLGATVERQLQTPRIVQLRVGESLLDLVPRIKGGRGNAATRKALANLDHFAFRVAPFDRKALVRRLARFGIEPGDVRDRYGAEGYGPSVYFNDPDGNMVELKGPATRPRITRAR